MIPAECASDVKIILCFALHLTQQTFLVSPYSSTGIETISSIRIHLLPLFMFPLGSLSLYMIFGMENYDFLGVRSGFMNPAIPFRGLAEISGKPGI